MRLWNGYGSITKLTGNRRKPYMIRVKTSYNLNDDGKVCEHRKILGYTKTRAEALEMLSEYNKNPYNVNDSKQTFKKVFDKWSKEKFISLSNSSVLKYNASFKICEPIHDKRFKDLKTNDFQFIIDSSGKNYPTLKEIKNLFIQLSKHALKNDIIAKDYSHFVDINKWKDKNPNAIERTIFTPDEIDKLWQLSNDKYVQIILMMIYSGVRVGEMMALRCENINLEERYFKVVKSKTESGVRIVPIADKVYKFYESWFKEDSDYLIHYPDGRMLKDSAFRECYWQPLMEQLDMKHKPHDTRHTCASLLKINKADSTTTKKILGHKGEMDLTEKVYTHLNVQMLLEEINKI